MGTSSSTQNGTGIRQSSSSTKNGTTAQPSSSTQNGRGGHQTTTADSPNKATRKQTNTKFVALKDDMEKIVDVDNPKMCLSWITEAEKQLLDLKGKYGYSVKPEEPSQKRKETRDKIGTLKQNLDDIETKRQELINQISSVAGARLKNNNPAIADLSDENRPVKLAEKFSELYDNEWTNVMDVFKNIASQQRQESDDKIERDIIKFLLDTLTNIYELCKNTSDSQLNGFISLLMFSPKEDLNESENPIYENHDFSNEAIPAEVEKRCKEIIKRSSIDNIVDRLGKEYFNQRRSSDSLQIFEKHQNDPTFEAYIRKCIKYCWLMCVQDPPIKMTWDTHTVTQYRAYTRSGEFIEFVVWPALLLHAGGPLLYKGVAQFCKTR